MKRLLLLLIIVGWSSHLSAADPAPEEDLQSLQGKWVRQMHDKRAGPVTVEQELTKDHADVKVIDRQGNVIYRHKVKFRLQRLEDVNLLVYYDLEVLEGHKKGFKQKTIQPCIYRLKGDRLYVAEGLVNGDSFPPQILVWWKVKPPATDAAL
ncbi:hypothetical protein [uncultured Gimesia sp.]|uniref:hypothetical protein n=1 Tax=uncultured Gimesia sp. TaxID=1678688 RepID=UPI0030DB3FA5|tara:strand:+ start:319609 stop:320064 length:456 start_codon:yes stop_codon:yes gene_type:complete